LRSFALRSNLIYRHTAMKSHSLILAVLLPALLLSSFMAEARGPWRATEENTRGWQLMTPQERIEHQARIRSFETLEACRAYQLEHHQLMLQRARAKGSALPANDRDICAHLKPAP
jgi:hypothetical protein